MTDKSDIDKEKQKEKEELVKFYNSWTTAFEEFSEYALGKFKYLRLDDTWAQRILIVLLIDHVKLTSSPEIFEKVKSYIYSVLEEDIFYNYLQTDDKSKPLISNNVVKLIIDNDKKPKKNN